MGPGEWSTSSSQLSPTPGDLAASILPFPRELFVAHFCPLRTAPSAFFVLSGLSLITQQGRLYLAILFRCNDYKTSFPRYERVLRVSLHMRFPKGLFAHLGFLVGEKLGHRLLTCVRGHKHTRCGSSSRYVRGHNCEQRFRRNRENARIFLRSHIFSRTMSREQLCYDKEQ